MTEIFSGGSADVFWKDPFRAVRQISTVHAYNTKRYIMGKSSGV